MKSKYFFRHTKPERINTVQLTLQEMLKEILQVDGRGQEMKPDLLMGNGNCIGKQDFFHCLMLFHCLKLSFCPVLYVSFHKGFGVINSPYLL